MRMIENCIMKQISRSIIDNEYYTRQYIIPSKNIILTETGSAGHRMLHYIRDEGLYNFKHYQV